MDRTRLRVDFEILPGTRLPGIPVFRLRAMISNDSPEPAFYGVINILIDSAVTVFDTQELTSPHEIHEETLFGQVIKFKILQRIWSSQSGLPIWLSQPLPVSFNGILIGAPRIDTYHVIGWQVTSPKMPVKKGFYRLDSFGLAPLI